MELLYTFSNTHAVISAEQVLLSAGVPIKVMPVPNAITAGCGLCLRIAPEHSEQAEAEMIKQSIAIASVYQMGDGFYKLVVGHGPDNKRDIDRLQK